MTSEARSSGAEALSVFLRGVRGEVTWVLASRPLEERGVVGRFFDPEVAVVTGRPGAGCVDAVLEGALRELSLWILGDRSRSPVEQQALLEAARARAEAMSRPPGGWSRDGLERIFESSPIAALVLEADGRLSWRNEAMVELLGYDLAESLSGRSLGELVQSEAARRIYQMLLSGEVVRVEGLPHRSVETGREHIFALQGIPLYDGAGRFEGVCVLASDRRQHEALVRRLDHSQEVFAGIIDAIGDPVLTCDAGWSVMSWNRAAEEVLHLSHRDTSRHLGRVVSRLGAKLSPVDLDELLESRGELPLEVASMGELVSYGVRVWEMPAEDGLWAGLRVVMLRDMRLELERQHHLRLSKERLEQVNRELRHRNDAKVEFMNIVSHDLRSPLVTMRGYVEMVLREALGPLTEAQRQGLGVALRNAISLSEQIDTLLDYSRIEQGRMEYVRTAVALAPVIHKVVDTVRGAASSKQLQVEVSVHLPEDLRVVADAEKLPRVLRALLNNAVKFTEEGRIGLDARLLGRQVELSVWDTGAGIEPADLRHIFSSFYTSERGRGERARGMGLGLSVARSMVEGQGSELRVESRAGQGSRFSFALDVVPTSEAG